MTVDDESGGMWEAVAIAQDLLSREVNFQRPSEAQGITPPTFCLNETWGIKIMKISYIHTRAI
jgi:hypothetical protein